MIRSVMQSDAEEIAAIYNHYIKNTVVTFEESITSPEDILQRIALVESWQVRLYMP